jgi:hypothetical protein
MKVVQSVKARRRTDTHRRPTRSGRQIALSAVQAIPDAQGERDRDLFRAAAPQDRRRTKTPPRRCCSSSPAKLTLKAGGTGRKQCPPAPFILLDAGSAPGLNETGGPAGYTAIKVQLAD